MAGIARVALVLAVTLGGCQAFLVFTPEPDGSAPSDASLQESAALAEVAPPGGDGGVDGPAPDADRLVCPDGATCIDFEDGPNLGVYGLLVTDGDNGAIVECDRGSPNNRCLGWTQPYWRAERAIDSGVGTRFSWDLWIDCRFDGGTEPFAYLGSLSFGGSWIVVACSNVNATTNLVQVATHTSDDGGVTLDVKTLGLSPTAVHIEVDLSSRLVQAAIPGQDASTLDVPAGTPGAWGDLGLRFGAVDDASRYIVAVDDIVIRRLQ